jgi:hypothetical protein
MKKSDNSIQDFLSALFLTIFGLIFLAMFVFFIQNSNLFDWDKKAEENQSKQLKSFSTNKGNPDTTTHKSAEYSQPFSPTTQLTKNNEIFMPATANFSVFNHSPSQFDGQPQDLMKQLPEQKLITINKGEKNDIYLVGIYDEMAKGGFRRSQNLKIIPPEETKKNYLNITVKLPSAKDGSIIQVPICFKGIIANSFSHNLNYTLTPSGSLKIVSSPNQKEKTYLSYTVKRTKEPLQINPSTSISPWLKKEFKQIPEKILKLLNETKKAPRNTKLTLVAAILNSQFEYQAQQNQVTKPAGKSWNHLLRKSLKKGHKLFADCDVLSTFAYIYLKFLDIHPAFIIGYFNLSNPNQLENNELHATLYLPSNKKPLFFESTIFAEHTPSLQQPESKERAKTKKNAPEINYFLPFQKIWDKFQENKKTTANLPLDRAWEKIKNHQPKQQKTKKQPLSIQFIYRLASLILFFSLTILGIILYIKNKTRKAKQAKQ